ncbi:MAG: NAD(P)(+) transhydrogenase (Re/Si-specific) subunit beta [SAR86 cluster bacterium]|uniref:NAD(P) transhydrogenase subunit beta n=1 Tax=SAR86 cluster bacterium TaxID=2030880 RepID=A0A368BLM4_9GAMM|nr:MAG: NAD(P)(+) transhydrogenase (Re/Si-specific) subunit beta [SAR86 cluster bacterium]
MSVDLNFLQQIGYVFSAMLFIYGLKMLGKEDTAVKGNVISALGMLLALLVTFGNILNPVLIFSAILTGGVIGSIFAIKVKMTSIPEMVALFNGFGGLSSFFLAWSEFNTYASVSVILFVTCLTVFIGGVTFSGSLIAYFKLSEIFKGSSKTLNTISRWLLIVFLGYLAIAMLQVISSSFGFFVFDFEIIKIVFLGLLVISLLSGLAFVLPIGGGDMPVVISLLNSLSGIAAAMAGILLSNTALIVAGCLVGASGLILTLIMAKSMNRTLFNIFFVGFSDTGVSGGEVEGEVKPISAEDTFLILEAASSILVVPGYGMAVAQAQHVVKELGDLLEENNAEISYGIHPVAGRMPGHMNVLLAEANVSYDNLFEPKDLNPRMETVDVVLVIGANDVVNPSATEQPGSPIYGMPIIEVHKAKTVVVLKRSMSSGFAGVQNPLFFKENTRMLFGDAKESISKLVAEFKE